MSNHDDLIAWLRAQLDDDERVARAVAGHRQRRGELRWLQSDPEREPGLISDGCGNVVTYHEGSPNQWQSAHIVRHDPARVLAEVDAKRRILDVYRADVIDVSVVPGRPEWIHGAVPVEAHAVLRLLALPYADRPGYRDEWRP